MSKPTRTLYVKGKKPRVLNDDEVAPGAKIVKKAPSTSVAKPAPAEDSKVD